MSRALPVVLTLMLALPGCAARPLKQSLPGQTAEQVIERLGPPDSDVQTQGRPGLGPFPAGLGAADPCRCLLCRNYEGEQVHVFCLPPEVYARLRGARPPGEAAWWAIQVETFPTDVVF